MGWGHQQKLRGGAEGFKGELTQRGQKGRASWIESGGNRSEATGRQVRWPDSELSSRAAVATSCEEEKRDEAGAQRECRLQGP